MEEDLLYKVIEMKSGEQIPVAATAGVSVSIVLFATKRDDMSREIYLDVAPEEFDEVRNLAKTNSIGDDILKDKEVVTSKEN